MTKENSKGIVYLVGAGPGDLELMTLKAKRLVENCDALLYDYLANEELLTWAREDCKKICVGKRKGFHSKPQEEIQALLVKLASEGKNIVRLKGGDPFIFGRGGEEAICLKRAGIKYEIVPAVTSALAAGAYAGIPLTHRNLSSSLTFISGHEAPGKDYVSVDWDAHAKIKGTLCLYMSMAHLDEILKKLINGGLEATTPVAIVQWASTPKQRICTGTAETIFKIAQKEEVTNPAIVFIGEVASLSEELQWLETKN